MNKSISLSIFLVLFVILNIFLLSLLYQNRNKLETSSNQINNQKKTIFNSYYVIKELLDCDTFKVVTKGTTLHVGLFINKYACQECNIEAINLLKSKFNHKNICLFTNATDTSFLSTYRLSNLNIPIVVGDTTIKSVDPLFFLCNNKYRFMKFSPDTRFPDVTILYFDQINKILMRYQSDLAVK